MHHAMKKLNPILAGGLALVAGGLVLSGCPQQGTSPATKSAAGGVKALTGAGATFPYPVYSRWARSYAQKSGVELNYQAIGSGGGIAQIEKKTVDFGASDAPLEPAELKKNGLVQWPMVMGGVVPVVNVKGIGPGQLKLSGALLAQIYLGDVKTWNDPAIVKLNPGVKLPSAPITTVHRSDGSGTTWIFTNYLSKVSPAWKSKVGNGKAVAWPTGVGGKGNPGVAKYVGSSDGTIGYVEYAYAIQNKLAHVKLQNQAGKFVSPSIASFQAAAGNADWAHADGFYMVLTDQPGAASWPIAGATFILMHVKPEHPDHALAALKFFSWAYANGDKAATSLDYVPMPDSVVALVKASWTKNIHDAKGKPIWTGSTPE